MKPEKYETKLEQTAQDTIEKYMADGLTLKEALDKWEKITYTVLPCQIKDLVRRDDGNTKVNQVSGQHLNISQGGKDLGLYCRW